MKQPPTIRDLYPRFSEEELREAQKKFDEYLLPQLSTLLDFGGGIFRAFSIKSYKSREFIAQAAVALIPHKTIELSVIIGRIKTRFFCFNNQEVVYIIFPPMNNNVRIDRLCAYVSDTYFRHFFNRR